MKKFFSLLLALVLLCSLIPMTTFAAFNPADYAYIHQQGNKWIGGKLNHPQATPIDVDITAEYNAYLKSLEGNQKDDGKKDDKKKDDSKTNLTHTTKDEIVGYGCDTKYHWWQCSCGCKIGMELHVDPKNTTNDTCICGYHFSDNADLVTLWVNGCPPIKKFNKEKTEYKLNAHTYKDVQEIQIATRTYDSQATVELPEDLTLKAGENKFEVKVIAENQKVTKVYTLIITK